MPPFRRVLIANRGEIAVRVLRACEAEGVDGVTIHSEADASALWVQRAVESHRVGPAPVQQSYLNVEAILEAARRSRVDAIHPGYGLLSENAGFARRVAEAGFVWIGPRHETIEQMGVKTEARAAMRAAGVPVVPGSDGVLESPESAKHLARELGYPVMVKAASGGGGIGMELARDEASLDRALAGVAERAKRFFGSAGVYLEKALARPRHIEVQIFGDGRGGAVHLFERECSIQRRHQKVVEEAPSPHANAALRAELAALAVRAARAIEYRGAGTVECMVDAEGGFYFLEMNCRLQVEHPVTECVTGIDVVREQLRVAAGAPLSFRQEDLRCQGSAIECRLYAEDPDRNFLPSPGPIQEFSVPSAPGVRVDTGFGPGDAITPYYDPLIAKLVFHAASRPEAIALAREALAETRVGPLRTNLPLHRRILESEAFQSGDLATDFLLRLSQASAPR